VDRNGDWRRPNQNRFEVVILPPQTAGPASPLGRQGAYPEALDDATVRRLDELGDRLAKIVNIGVGLFFLLSGLAGFLWLGISSYHPKGSWVPNVSLVSRLLLSCGFFVFIGVAILRHALKKLDTAWLIPLKVFTSIVSRRVKH